MPKLSDPSPELNRLRAAAGLIPLIEDGLRVGKITPEKAALMAEFCGWALSHGIKNDAEASRLAGEIQSGLARLKIVLQS